MNIFLSVPFTSKVDANNNVLPEYRQQIERVLAGLRAQGHEVFCALEHAGWRIDTAADAAQEFQYDFARIDTADLLIVLLEERISAGVQLELGYAYAKGKQITMYQIGNAGWSNAAFARVAGRGLHPAKDSDDFVRSVLAEYADTQKG